MAIEHVAEIHHLHIWSLDGQHHVLTAHLSLDFLPGMERQLAIKSEIRKRLEAFDFSHTTVELEFPDEICRDIGTP